MKRNGFLLAIVIGQGLLIGLLLWLRFQEPPVEQVPVAATSTAESTVEPVTPPDGDGTIRESTLAEALSIARTGLAHLRENLVDYRSRVIKRERVDGKLLDEQELELKVLCRRREQGKIVQPMRVYLKFLSPESIAGREAIWAEDQNDGRLIGHEAGIMNLASASLDPTGERAMEGNLYPITEIGVVNLVEQLIARGENDLTESQVRVTLKEDQRIGDRSCTRIRIELVQPSETLNFQYAEIFIDMERQLPLRYAAYGWPDSVGDDGNGVQEEYTYLDLETNVGLTETDFDPSNEAYNFPALRLSL
ncbi:MAG: DUF1571 domain-containing protein [Pirellulaceae bacterium]